MAGCSRSFEGRPCASRTVREQEAGLLGAVYSRAGPAETGSPARHWALLGGREQKDPEAHCVVSRCLLFPSQQDACAQRLWRAERVSVGEEAGAWLPERLTTVSVWESQGRLRRT